MIYKDILINEDNQIFNSFQNINTNINNPEGKSKAGAIIN
jgi:hypothetical protein